MYSIIYEISSHYVLIKFADFIHVCERGTDFVNLKRQGRAMDRLAFVENIQYFTHIRSSEAQGGTKSQILKETMKSNHMFQGRRASTLKNLLLKAKRYFLEQHNAYQDT